MLDQIKVVGKTEDGKLVVVGLFKLVETYGVQLDLMVDFLEQQNMIIDWIEFLEQSINQNWNIRTTLSKIEVVLIDVKGKEYSNTVIDRLKYYITIRKIT